MPVSHTELNLLARIHMKREVALPEDEREHLLDPACQLIEIGPAGRYVLTEKGREVLIDNGRLANSW